MSWREVGRLGPYFAVERRQPGEGWRSLAEFTDGQVALAERTEWARRSIAARADVAVDEVAERVAASVVSLGLMARLLGPALASAVLSGVVPVLTRSTVWWRPVGGGPWPIAVDEVATVAAAPGCPAAQAITEHVLDSLIAAIIDAAADQFRLSRRVLWGNAASALGGAASMLPSPAQRELAGRTVVALLAAGPLAGAAEWTPAADGGRLRRRSCCLFYRVPGAGTCGDCVLNSRGLV
jgi:hypothetical protein